ncbi:hypothetical protein [Paraburkholderia tropica]|uniref:Uncharacterized protein n=1 Tax=Paraburkholderia tropica TaxID=92647 RepID=A0AAQ1GN22_9BURK|nr:hypothetical protein [Paraburkholderia tropica]RQN37223.1 hypothetical protein EHZ25_19925 [Paraburkholderia tropica]SEK13150.1 hypothetical protein SAMN05216550_123104 [Paraburkholderia tropica]
MKKHLATIAAALTLSGAAQAATGSPDYVLTVGLAHDGTPLATSTSIIRDSLGAVSPLLFESGQSIGYGVCTKLANGIKLDSHQKFVGRRLLVDTKNSVGGSFDLVVSAADTSLSGVTKTGPADCVSEVVNTTGLDVHDVAVHLNAGESTTVRLGDPHYTLMLKLVAE